MAKVGRGPGHTDGQGNQVRWILGFDGGCAACSKLAREVEEIAGDRLTSRSLADPEVRVWREATLGPDAVWEPTLLRVAGSEVQAWTGRAMSWRLTRLVGARAAYRIAKVIVHLEVEPVDVPNPSRRAFMRRAGGVVVGAGLLAVGPRALALAKATGQTSGSTSVVSSMSDAPASEASQLTPSLTKYATSISTYGAPDWSSLRKVTYIDGSIAYLVMLASASSASSSALVFADPSVGPTIPPLITHLSIDANNTPVFQFTTGDGRLVASATFNGQHLVPYGGMAPGTVEPDVSFDCIFNCLINLGVSGSTAQDCASCFILGSPLACAACLAFASVEAYYCYSQCSGGSGGGGGGCGRCEVATV